MGSKGDGGAGADTWPGGRDLRLQLLGGVGLCAGEERVAIPGQSERLLVLLALGSAPIRRQEAANLLRPDVREGLASLSLRVTLSRLAPAVRQALVVTRSELGIADTVAVDLRGARALARRVGEEGGYRGLGERPVGEVILMLSKPLLQGWYDDWAVEHVEEWDALRLAALETLASDLTAASRFTDAAAAARAAVRLDRYRESSQMALIGVHLAEGNATQARRLVSGYENLVGDELGARPSRDFYRLLAQAGWEPDTLAG